VVTVGDDYAQEALDELSSAILCMQVDEISCDLAHVGEMNKATFSILELSSSGCSEQLERTVECVRTSAIQSPSTSSQPLRKQIVFVSLCSTQRVQSSMDIQVLRALFVQRNLIDA
jgi:hypothetical protein